MRRFVLGWKRLGHEKRFGAYIVNYADDLVICCRGRAEEALATTRVMMKKLKRNSSRPLPESNQKGWGGDSATSAPPLPTASLAAVFHSIALRTSASLNRPNYRMDRLRFVVSHPCARKKCRDEDPAPGSFPAPRLN
jgi:hypothetical protein